VHACSLLIVLSHLFHMKQGHDVRLEDKSLIVET
jgi:hypothetical protein